MTVFFVFEQKKQWSRNAAPLQMQAISILDQPELERLKRSVAPPQVCSSPTRFGKSSARLIVDAALQATYGFSSCVKSWSTAAGAL